MSQTEDSKLIAGLSSSFFVIMCALIGMILIICSLIFSDNISWQDILLACGGSIVASTLIYLFYSKFAEQKTLTYVANNVTERAINQSFNLFTTRFENMLPSKVYPETKVPIKDYDLHFLDVLNRSKIYYYKGAAANYALFRLRELCACGKLPPNKEIRFILMDPRENHLFQNRAQTQIVYKNEYTINDLAEKYRNDVYVSLIALFDLRDKLNIEVAFHKESLFFRTQLFDSGLFLTYYIGHEFPAEYFYGENTLSYLAFRQNFLDNYKIKDFHFTITPNITNEDIIEILKSLKCNYSIEDLRYKKEEAYKRYSEMVKT